MKGNKLLVLGRLICAAALCLAFVRPDHCIAQTPTFATVVGIATDPAGAVVPGVQLTAKNAETNLTYKGTTNGVGDYRIEALPRGRYTLTAEMAGFHAEVVQDILLESNDVRRVDLKLTLGDVATKVEVQGGGATLIETETARFSDLREDRQMNMLPLSSYHDLYTQTLLTPGGMSRKSADGNGSGTSFAGSQANQIRITVDGSDVSALGPIGNFIESFQEVKTQYSNNSAEFGELANLSVVSKAGTNQLHGSLFDYYSTPGLRARESFAVQRDDSITHDLGGSIGGPVRIPHVYNGSNKTFFYFNWESNRFNATAEYLNPVVPLAAWRDGDFSALGTTIFDPTNGLPFPGNKIPPTRINSVSQKIQNQFYPSPNVGDPNVFTGQPNYLQTAYDPADIPNYLVFRADHRFTQRDDVFGRYTFWGETEPSYQGNMPTIGPWTQFRKNYVVTSAWVHTFSPTLINESHFTFTQDVEPYQGPIKGPPLVVSLGLKGLAPTIPTDPNYGGILDVSWGDLPLQEITQIAHTYYGNASKIAYDTLSWHRGRHTLKFGGQLYFYSTDTASSNGCLFGCVDFSATYSGFGYSDFLLGLPDSATRNWGEQDQFLHRYGVGFFAQDDFKVTPKLTLNLGIRYEVMLPWRDKNNQFSTFDPKTGKIVVPDAVFGTSAISPFMPTNYVGIIKASDAGFSQGLINTDTNNFAPRVGLAWRPFAGTTTVLRAGYGIFYNVSPATPSTDGVPFLVYEPTYTNPVPYTSSTLAFPYVFPSTGAGGPSTVSIPTAVNPSQAVPYTQQFNFTLEHERWKTGFRLSYLGTYTRKMIYTYNLNSPVPDNNLFVNKPRPFSNYPTVNYSTNGGSHDYNALMLEAKRKVAQGLFFQEALTWARDIGDDYTPENPFNLARERGPDLAIPNLRWTGNFIYDLPVGKGRHFASGASGALNAIIGGWSISGITVFQTGEHLTVKNRARDVTGTAYTSSKTPPYVTWRPDCVADPNLAAGQQTLYQWFNSSAFVPVPAGSGRFGNCGRGVVVGPGQSTVGLGLFKVFHLTDRAWLRYEMVANNALNHPNYGNPGLTLSSPGSFGVITSASGQNSRDLAGPRSIRMALRLQF